MSRQNPNGYNNSRFFKPEEWQELGFRSWEAWQQRRYVRTRHWELYAEPDDPRHEIESGEHVNAEEDGESEGHVESANESGLRNTVNSTNHNDAEDDVDYTEITDQPYELPEEEYDHLLELLESNAAASRDYTELPYELPEEVYDHLLELPANNIGDGFSEDFSAALIWGETQKRGNNSDDESASRHSIDDDQTTDSGSEDEEDEGERSDENSVNSRKHSRVSFRSYYPNKRAKGSD